MSDIHRLPCVNKSSSILQPWKLTLKVLDIHLILKIYKSYLQSSNRYCVWFQRDTAVRIASTDAALARWRVAIIGSVVVATAQSAVSASAIDEASPSATITWKAVAASKLSACTARWFGWLINKAIPSTQSYFIVCAQRGLSTRIMNGHIESCDIIPSHVI